MGKCFKTAYMIAVAIMFTAVFSADTTAFAAEGSQETKGVSNTVMVMIMVALFIISAAAAGFITFKIRKNKTASSVKAEEAKTDDTKEA